jgi:hypothetical protein
MNYPKFLGIKELQAKQMIEQLAAKLGLNLEPRHKLFAKSETLIIYYDEYEMTVKIEEISPEISNEVVSQIVEMLKSKQGH